MNVKELIEILEKYPPEMKVLQRGYESGYNDIYEVEKETVQHVDVGTSYWEGDYQSTGLSGFGKPIGEPEDCVLIGG